MLAQRTDLKMASKPVSPFPQPGLVAGVPSAAAEAVGYTPP
jgi:hypothetical protein